jgi:hypothetical protein
MMHPVCKVWASFGQKLRLEFGSLVRVRAEYCCEGGGSFFPACEHAGASQAKKGTTK